jgi:DNA-binding NarL/FixJ family response regulator
VIRVAIIEDHTIVRQGLLSLLKSQPDISVCGEVGTGTEGVALARAEQPDVVVLDLGLPDMSGVDVIYALRETSPETRVVVLSMHAEAEYVRPALRAGAAGYLVKGADIGDLVKAVQCAMAGEVLLSPGVAKVVLEGSGPDVAARLTEREVEVLRYVAGGKTSREVARILGISAKTVDNHRQNVMTKLGLHDVASLTRFAIRAGLVAPE